MAGEDPAYLGRVAALPCCAAGRGRCNGPVQAHHRSTGRVARAPVKGGDRRAHDHDAIPLCMLHHDAWHGCRGDFRDMSKPMREDWEAAKVDVTRRALGLV
jgi:hypothetical protein